MGSQSRFRVVGYHTTQNYIISLFVLFSLTIRAMPLPDRPCIAEVAWTDTTPGMTALGRAGLYACFVSSPSTMSAFVVIGCIIQTAPYACIFRCTRRFKSQLYFYLAPIYFAFFPILSIFKRCILFVPYRTEAHRQFECFVARMMKGSARRGLWRWVGNSFAPKTRGKPRALLCYFIALD